MSLSSRADKETLVKPKVWIVEDTRLDALRAERVLSELADCEVFDHGAAMLERIASQGPPDVLVLDWQLPEISGIELCRFLRTSYDEARLPIVLVTVKSAVEEIAEALASGANDFVAKPFDVVELKARVGAALRTKRLFSRARRAEEALERERDRLHESEAKFRRLAESGIIGIVIMDIAGNVLEANDAFLTMVGHTRAELAGGRVRMRDLTPAEYLDADDQAFREMLELGVCAQYEKELIRKDGQRMSVLHGAAILEREKPRAIGYLLDITEHRSVEADRSRLYEAERKARAEAELASRMKDEFLATVSHELRTPLNAILGWAQIARVQARDSQLDKALETIERNARAQSKLINDILDISRIISGKVRLEGGPIDFSELALQTVETVRPAAAAKRIELVCDVPNNTPIVADADRLQQVIWNLLSNAVKFTPQGGVVSLSLQRHDDRYRLCVADNGQGVEPSFLPHVFDRFRQADASTTRTQGGLGLGLSIVRNLVELHGGRVWASSEGRGKGSKFWIDIPANTKIEPTPVPPSAEVGPASVSEPQQVSLSGLRILVVDDEADSRAFLSSLLAQFGALVVEASSAHEGFEAFKASQPDVLVSDVAMPVEDGYGLLRRIRALPKERGGQVPALALTAYARQEDQVRALSEGFQMHMAKPVDSYQMLNAISRLSQGGARP